MTNINIDIDTSLVKDVNWHIPKGIRIRWLGWGGRRPPQANHSG